MEYQIVEEPSFKVVGKAIRVATKDGENMRRIPQFWQESVRDGWHEELVSLAGSGAVLKGAILGICTDFAEDMSEFTYMIAAEAPREGVPSGMVEETILAAIRSL